MSARVHLRVSEKFLQSDFLPPISLFSGRTDNLRLEWIKVGVPKAGSHQWLQLGDSRNLILRLPMAPGEWRRWKFWRTVWFTAGGPLIALLLFALCCGISGFGFRNSYYLHLVPAALAVLEIVVMLGLHFFVLWDLPRFHYYRGSILNVMVSLPARRLPLLPIYEAAYKNWVAAGSPPPEKPEEDEGWEDQAQTGWDEVGNRT